MPKSPEFQAHVDSAEGRLSLAGDCRAADLGTMLAGFGADPNLAIEAGEDEERFVDRANSVMFISDVVHRA